jgi:DDE family transposase
VSKVAGADQGVNPRLVVTALEQARTQGLSQQISGARGHAENASKEHQQDVHSDRTSGQRCEANQWRGFLQAAASVLLETFRREVFRTTQGAAATMATIQGRFRNLGARVQEGEERITMAFPAACPVAPVVRHSWDVLACVRATSQVLGSSVASVEGPRAKSVWSA